MSDDNPATEAIYEIGTLASVPQLLKLPDGTVKVLVEGAQRAKVVKYTDCSEYYEAEAVALGDTMGERVEAKALARAVTNDFESYAKLNKRVPPEVVGVVQQIEDYAKLADTVASHLALKIPDRQAILETTAVTERLEKVLGLIDSEISVLPVEKRIRTRVKRQMEKTQREFFLNEQMKAIQKELGDEEGKDELAEIEDKIKKTKLSKEAREKATHELKKLRQMSPMSGESTVVRNYLDWLSCRSRGPSAPRSRRTSSLPRRFSTMIISVRGVQIEAVVFHDRLFGRLLDDHRRRSRSLLRRLRGDRQWGGFLGTGQHHYPVPWSSLKYNLARRAYETTLTLEELRNGPSELDGEAFDWGDRSPVYRHPQYWTV